MRMVKPHHIEKEQMSLELLFQMEQNIQIAPHMERSAPLPDKELQMDKVFVRALCR